MNTNTLLYHLNADLESLDALLDATDGEVTPEVEALLAHLAGAETNIGDLARAVVEAEAVGDLYATEIARLTRLKNLRQRFVERVKECMVKYMETTGVTQAQTEVGKLSLRRNSQPSVAFEKPLDELPASLVACRETITKITPDRKKIVMLAQIEDPLLDAAGVKVKWGSHVRIG